MEIPEELIDEEIKFTTKIINNYGDQLPRFTIDGMNQSEFIGHISARAFNAGWRECEKYNKEKAR